MSLLIYDSGYSIERNFLKYDTNYTSNLTRLALAAISVNVSFYGYKVFSNYYNLAVTSCNCSSGEDACFIIESISADI